MRLLIIGAGQDGQLAAAKACELSIPTLVVSRRFPEFIRSIAERNPGMLTLSQQEEGYLLDEAPLRVTVKDFAPTAVFYTASHHGPSGTMKNDASSSALYRETSVFGLSRLADAISSQPSQADLLFSLSSRMFRPTSNGRPIDEYSQPDPADAYGEAKAEAWSVLKEMRSSGLSAGGLIFFNHDSFLKGQGYLGTDIANQLGESLVQGKSFSTVKLRNPAGLVDLSNAWDFATAVIRLLSSRQIDDYVVSSGSLTSAKELVEAAAEKLGVTADCQASNPNFQPVSAAAVYGDYSKLRNALQSDWDSNAPEAIALTALISSGRPGAIEIFLRNRKNAAPKQLLEV